MTAETGMNEREMSQSELLKAIGRMGALNGNNQSLITRGKRTKGEVAVLLDAQQAFKDGKLAGIILRQKKLDPEHLNAICNTPIERTSLRPSDLRYLQQRGIRYVGEFVGRFLFEAYSSLRRCSNV